MPRMQRKKTMPPETLGARIKRLRTERGLSQPELAAVLHVDHATISRWETDRRTPQRTHRAGLSAALGISWESLTGRPELLRLEPMDRRQPRLRPLREAISRVQAMGNDTLLVFVSDVVGMVNHMGQRKGR
jgi:transcriptional regulator with XRE-family HTH domain